MDGKLARLFGLFGAIALMASTIIALMTENHPTWEAVIVLMLGNLALIAWGNGELSQ